MAAVSTSGKVIKNEWVNDEYKHMVIETEQKASEVEPGQFFNLICPPSGKDQPFFPRPMSTYKANSNGQVEFLYKVQGKGTRGLATLEQGNDLEFLGPLGKGFTVKPDYKHILVIGRGVGLATLAPLAEYATEKNVAVTAILSAKDQPRVMSRYRFEEANAEIFEALDSDGSSDMARVEDLIRTIHATHPIDCFYTCGSKRIVALLKNLALELDIQGEVAVEEQMSCGLGMCCGCVKPVQKINEPPKAKKVCKDGPVFDLLEMIV
ncbi:dihydroorotate dehydrogenase electron transfer subunit [Vibrio sp. STUT-A11]|uniref:dihydroorotate dehydrogenase electron transfer subunit n=1 Tax=Vibrio sp. STUT-A11 TaxID=2976236 RepID=UPI002231886C|nr:dihydroorotate dehydrogenase electron transfer subunit [Vibrio sp. STUT-A11]BDR14456.1 dihydroorotate dehydrogenase B (NAD(+)), electron transfer subunit [Vibrio sp. STUT-A11]